MLHTIPLAGPVDALGLTQDSSWLMIVAVMTLVVQMFFWATYFRIRYGAGDWISRIFDRDSYPSGSAWEAFHEAVLQRHAHAPLDLSLVVSPTRRYRLAELLASGDLCDVYRATSGKHRCLLKIPRATGCDLLLGKEQTILRQIARESGGSLYGEYFPQAIESFQSDGRLVSALTWRSGFFTATDIRNRYPSGLDARHLGWMFNRMLEALGFIHRLGWVHGAVLPSHLLFHTANHGMQLIGWTHAVPIDAPLPIVSRDFRAWYPAACHRREPATSTTDVHLAVKSMIWMAGGDPIDDELPDHVPIEMAAFFHECLSVANSDRSDAWALHEQFRELLENLFGPPRFCHLAMS